MSISESALPGRPAPGDEQLRPSEGQVAILAGNSRLAVGEDGSILVEAQRNAFEAAMRFAAEVRSRTGELPPISIAFDHKGVFRQHFLAGGLTNSQRRNPRLSQLRPEIVDVFESIARRHEIATDAILAIHEDSARTHLDHVLRTENVSNAIRHRMLADAGEDEKANSSCSLSGGRGPKVTCAAITREYFVKAAQARTTSASLLEVFFENSAWSQVLAYVRGLQMTHLLGSKNAIRLNLVDADGILHQGNIIEGHLK